MMRLTRFADLRTGMEVPFDTIEIDRLALVQYAGASGDYVRLHWDHPFMMAQGYPDVIAHGWLTCAHLCRVVARFVPPDIADIRRYAICYRRPFHPGTLICGGVVKAVAPDTAKLALWAKNAGDEIVATATMTLWAITLSAD